MAIATGGSRPQVTKSLAAVGLLEGFFDAIVTCNDVTHGAGGSQGLALPLPKPSLAWTCGACKSRSRHTLPEESAGSALRNLHYFVLPLMAAAALRPYLVCPPPTQLHHR